jgi:tetratricopeptide (TPR) repeat protein
MVSKPVVWNRVKQAVRDHLLMAMSELPAPQEASAEENRVRMALAHALRAVQEQTNADILYAAVLKTNQEHRGALLGLIDSAYEARDFERALARSGDALEVFPGDAELIIRNAEALARLGRTTEAAGLVRRLGENVLNTISLRMRAGRLLEDTGDRQAADVQYLKVLKEKPDHPGALLRRIEIALSLRDSDLALERCERALSHHPKNFGILRCRARALQISGRAREAVALLSDYLDANPGHIPAQMALGAGHRVCGDMAAADRIFAGILENTPDHRGALLNRIDLALRAGDIDAALERCEAALAFFPADLQVQRKRAKSLVRAGRAMEAATELERLSQASPGDMGLLIERAHVQLALGAFDAAENLFDEVLQRQPDNDAALLGKVTVAEKRGDLETAMTWLEQGIHRVRG